MIFRRFVLGPLVNNVYLLGDEETKEAIVIDASFEEEKVVEEAKRLGLEVKTILLTHGHVDHIVGAGGLAEATGAEIAIHEKDLWLYERCEEQARMFGLGGSALPEPDRIVREGDVIEFGKHRLTMVETPGHTPGSLCVAGEVALDGGRRAIFSGDTLFCGSIGRTDLWGGDYGEIVRSIRRKLFRHDPNTLVLPGHGEQTTIGAEKEQNPFVGDAAASDLESDPGERDR